MKRRSSSNRKYWGDGLIKIPLFSKEFYLPLFPLNVRFVHVCSIISRQHLIIKDEIKKQLANMCPEGPLF